MPGRREHADVSGHSLALEVDGVRVTMLTEVSGLALERDVVEVKQTAPDGTLVVKRLPGKHKPGEVTLTRGITSDRTFEQWTRDVSLGATGQPGAVSIVVLDHQGELVASYALTGAWPRRLEVDGLRAGGIEVPTERLVLVYESFERA